MTWINHRHRLAWAGFRIATYAIALFLFGLTAPVRADCGLSVELNTLKMQLEKSAGANGRLAAHDTETIAAMLAMVDRSAISTRLRQLNLYQYLSIVDQLLLSAKQIGSSGRVSDAYGLKTDLYNLARLNATICDADPNQDIGHLSLLQGITLEIGLVAVALGLTSAEHAFHLGRMLLLGALVLIVILVPLTGKQLYIWIWALRYSRKACRINAVLSFPNDTVEGSVTILGRRGCRFQPVDKEAFNRLRPLAVKHSPTLIIGSQQASGRVEGLHGVFAVVEFREQLSLKAHTAMLKQSKITPYFVAKNTPKPNVTQKA